MTAQFDLRNSAFGISPARRLAFMNLALRGIEADIGKEHADTFRSVQRPDLRADYVLVKSKAADAKPGFRDRRRETLFIDARKMGRRASRMNRELTK